MSGYEVEIGAIRTAAEATRSAAEQARTVEIRSAVTEVPTALHGSRSASALTRWADLFTVECQAWGDWAAAHADQLVASADLYVSNEQAANEAFRPAH
jgi:hypothetical protein